MKKYHTNTSTCCVGFINSLSLSLISCVCISYIFQLLWCYCDTAIPTCPKKISLVFRLWEGTNGGGDPGDCGLLSSKWVGSIFRPQVAWIKPPDHSKEWWWMLLAEYHGRNMYSHQSPIPWIKWHFWGGWIPLPKHDFVFGGVNIVWLCNECDCCWWLNFSWDLYWWLNMAKPSSAPSICLPASTVERCSFYLKQGRPEWGPNAPVKTSGRPQWTTMAPPWFRWSTAKAWPPKRTHSEKCRNMSKLDPFVLFESKRLAFLKTCNLRVIFWNPVFP